MPSSCQLASLQRPSLGRICYSSLSLPTCLSDAVSHVHGLYLAHPPNHARTATFTDISGNWHQNHIFPNHIQNLWKLLTLPVDLLFLCLQIEAPRTLPALHTASNPHMFEPVKRGTMDRQKSLEANRVFPSHFSLLIQTTKRLLFF